MHIFCHRGRNGAISGLAKLKSYAIGFSVVSVLCFSRRLVGSKETRHLKKNGSIQGKCRHMPPCKPPRHSLSRLFLQGVCHCCKASSSASQVVLVSLSLLLDGPIGVSDRGVERMSDDGEVAVRKELLVPSPGGLVVEISLFIAPLFGHHVLEGVLVESEQSRAAHARTYGSF